VTWGYVFFLAVTVEKSKTLVFLHRNLLLSLALLVKKPAKLDFFDSVASYRHLTQVFLAQDPHDGKKRCLHLILMSYV
jgi:hypothetical protein